MNTNGHEEKRGTYAARVRISAARRTEARWLLPLLPKKEERAGERRPFFVSLPSLQLSPRSFLAGREGKRPSAFLCRTLLVSRHVDRTREPSPFATSTPPGGMPTAKNRRSAVQIGPAEHNTGRRGNPIADSCGQDARLYGRQEAWPLQPKLFAILLT